MKTLIYVAGQEFKCKQSYAQIREALEAGAMRVAADEIRWMPALELQVKVADEWKWMLVQPHALAAVRMA